MNEPQASPNAEKQKRFRERRKTERLWFQRELTRLTVEIAKPRVDRLPEMKEPARV